MHHRLVAQFLGGGLSKTPVLRRHPSFSDCGRDYGDLTWIVQLFNFNKTNC